jgi:RNA polymerase sigma-70 factor (ECF subfamily)
MVVAREENLFWLMAERVPGEGTDAELVRRAQADLEAFVDLYNRYVEPVFRYCHRRLPRAAAEDATSITFLNAIRAIRGFDPERAGFRSWLFTIAHNAVIDQLRARPHVQIDEIELAEPGPSLDDRVIADERRRHCAHALRRLNPDQQQVIGLRLSGLSGTEIAEVMGKRPGAVRVIQHRAIKELRRLMGVRESGSANRTTAR